MTASGKKVRGEESSPKPILRLKVWGRQEAAVIRRKEGRREAGSTMTGRGQDHTEGNRELLPK